MWQSRWLRLSKEHFIANLESFSKFPPLHLWFQMKLHAIIILNLLQPSHISPKLSVYAQLHGAFDFNATTLVPLGTQIIAHEKPTVRGIWVTKGIGRWYICAAINRYRCHEVYVNMSQIKWINGTIDFPRITTTYLSNLPLRIQQSLQLNYHML